MEIFRIGLENGGWSGQPDETIIFIRNITASNLEEAKKEYIELLKKEFKDGWDKYWNPKKETHFACSIVEIKYVSKGYGKKGKE